MNKKNIVKNVRADDWTAELVIIASNGGLLWGRR